MNTTDDISKIKNRIWITAKSRIYSEKRFRRYDVASHLLLVLLSLTVITITLLDASHSSQEQIDTYTIIFSVFILVASIVVFGFRFGETAALHRECYLRLQQLYDSREKADEVERCYHEILAAYPNHTDFDYDCLVLGRTFGQDGGMSKPDGSSVSWTWGMLFRWAIHHLVFWSIPAFFLAISVALLACIW